MPENSNKDILETPAGPYLEPVMSKSKEPYSRIPVLGLFLDDTDEVFEIDADNLADMFSDMDGSFAGARKGMKLMSLPNVNEREIVGKIDTQNGVLNLYMGKSGSLLNKIEDADMKVSIDMDRVSVALMLFEGAAESFLLREQ